MFFTAWTAELALKDSLSCSWCGVSYHCWDGLCTSGLSRDFGGTSVTAVLCSFQKADGGLCYTLSPASIQERREKLRGDGVGQAVPCASLELQIGRGMHFAAGGSWEAASPPTCPRSAAGKHLSPGPLPARLSGCPWHGISHRQTAEGTFSFKAFSPSPSALKGLYPGLNKKRWIVLCICL